jgi:hypothetical protein
LKESPKKAIGIELTKLHGSTVKKGKLHFASKINGYQPPDLTKENIEFTINAKEEKLPIYNKKC